MYWSLSAIKSACRLRSSCKSSSLLSTFIFICVWASCVTQSAESQAQANTTNTLWPVIKLLGVSFLSFFFFFLLDEDLLFFFFLSFLSFFFLSFILRRSSGFFCLFLLPSADRSDDPLLLL